MQNADTFVDYANGTGRVLREVLPFVALIPTGSNYDGEITAGGDILFSGHKLSDQSALNALAGQSQTATVDHSAPVTEIAAPAPAPQLAADTNNN